MPLYEYQCERCGIRFERFQSFSALPARICPECNGPLRRIIFPAGIIFKGPGFYVTDNRKAQGSEAAGNGSKSEKKEEKAPSED